MYERWGKRWFDMLGALLLLVLFAPLIVATALAVGCCLGHPVLFRQPRMGQGGCIFTVVKFRSMATGGTPDAVRIGRFGRMLRAGGLDELPQLWQVLRGEMSLVGPRPLLPEDFALYTPRQKTRVRVRPGLTGLAQVAGRNAVPWAERLELDARYAERVTLRGDVLILLRTPGLLLTGRGVSAPGFATMPRFGFGEGTPGAHKSPAELPGGPA